MFTAYDRYIKLWNTETGQCISRFTSRKIPYCCKFNPDDDKQHLFVAGTSDKKIVCVSIKFVPKTNSHGIASYIFILCTVGY